MKGTDKKQIHAKRMVIQAGLVISIVTAVSLFIALLLPALGQVLKERQKNDLSENCLLTAYIKDGVKDISQLKKRLAQLPEVSSVEIQTADQVYGQFRSALGDDAAVVLKGVGPELFPSRVKIQVDFETLGRIELFNNKLKTQFSEFVEIVYPSSYLEENIKTVSIIIGAIDYAVWGIITLFAASSLLSVSMLIWLVREEIKSSRLILPLAGAAAGVMVVSILSLSQGSVMQFGVELSIPDLSWCAGLLAPAFCYSVLQWVLIATGPASTTEAVSSIVAGQQEC